MFTVSGANGTNKLDTKLGKAGMVDCAVNNIYLA